MNDVDLMMHRLGVAVAMCGRSFAIFRVFAWGISAREAHGSIRPW